MDDSPRTTLLHGAPAEPAARTTLPTFLHSLVPPYFLKWGPHVGVWYGLVSLTGFLCHIIFMAYVIAWVLLEGLDALIETLALPVALSTIVVDMGKGLDRLTDTADLPTWFALSFVGWWFVSSIWMAVSYRKHHDGTNGWRAYIFGGWGWRWWKRGNSTGDSDSDFDFD